MIIYVNLFKKIIVFHKDQNFIFHAYSSSFANFMQADIEKFQIIKPYQNFQYDNPKPLAKPSRFLLHLSKNNYFGLIKYHTSFIFCILVNFHEISSCI